MSARLSLGLRHPAVLRVQLWRYEGQNTLAYYLRRRDTLRALARDLDVPEEIVVPVAMRQLLLGLSALHSAGLVHRCGFGVPQHVCGDEGRLSCSPGLAEVPCTAAASSKESTKLPSSHLFQRQSQTASSPPPPAAVLFASACSRQPC